MELTAALAQLLVENEVERITAEQYQRSVRSFNAWIGRQASVDDLTVENLNAWILSLVELGKSPKTVRNYRVGLTRVWNYLTQLGLSEGYISKRLRQPKVVLKSPESWSQTNVNALLRACDDLKGQTKEGVPAGLLLRAWVLVGYASGLRPSDLRLLKWGQIDFTTGSLTLVQHKTNHHHTARLDLAAANALQAIRAPIRERIFISKSAMSRWERRLYKIAAIYGFKRKRGQGLGTLRKSHATEICRLQGLNAAAESLGHVSGSAIARLHYVQPDALRPGTLPPSLI